MTQGFNGHKRVHWQAAYVLTIAALVGCSNNPHYTREIENGERYLQSSGLQELKAPTGLILPVENSNYEITRVQRLGAVGKALDIRPPSQLLVTPDGTRIERDNSTNVLTFNKQRPALMQQVEAILLREQIPIAQRDNAGAQVTTDWVAWPQADATQAYRARYQITLQQGTSQQMLTVKLLELQQAQQPVLDAARIQHYNTQMMNKIAAALTHAVGEVPTEKVRPAAVVLQAERDDLGLPIIIVREKQNVVWQRLAVALTQVGMRLSKSGPAREQMRVDYLSPEKASVLANGRYTLRVVDLSNRTQLQFSDEHNRVITPAQNQFLVERLQTRLNGCQGEDCTAR